MPIERLIDSGFHRRRNVLQLLVKLIAGLVLVPPVRITMPVIVLADLVRGSNRFPVRISIVPRTKGSWWFSSSTASCHSAG
jgi:hypothetical protein